MEDADTVYLAPDDKTFTIAAIEDLVKREGLEMSQRPDHVIEISKFW